MFELLKNPIFKLVGVSLVIYFGLFHDTRNPESLGNVVSPQNLKSEISDVKEKGQFIISSVHLANQLAQNQNNAQLLDSPKNLKTVIKDKKVGEGEELSCGDEAIFKYSVYDKKNKMIQIFNSRKFTLEKNKEHIINNETLGMKVGGTRSVYIPYGFKSEDKELIENMKFAASDLRYEITLISILKKQTNSCQ